MSDGHSMLHPSRRKRRAGDPVLCTYEGMLTNVRTWWWANSKRFLDCVPRRAQTARGEKTRDFGPNDSVGCVRSYWGSLPVEIQAAISVTTCSPTWPSFSYSCGSEGPVPGMKK